MTAENPLGVSQSSEENNRRNRRLLKDLRDGHFTAMRVDPHWIMGKFGGNPEDSHVIPHIAKEALIELAAKYGQKAVIWGGKEADDQGPFMRFEWIETHEDKEPVSPSSYATLQTRDVVITGEGAIDRDDFFSATPFPRSGVDKRTTDKEGKPKPVTPRKFVIPFEFEPPHEFGAARYDVEKQGKFTKRGIAKEAYPDVSFVSDDLPLDDPEVKELVEEVQQKGRALMAEGKMPKWYWQTRMSLGVSVDNLRKLLEEKKSKSG
jgi:hypothetical protein